MGKQVYHHRLSTSPFFSRQILEQTRTHAHRHANWSRTSSVGKAIFCFTRHHQCFRNPCAGKFLFIMSRIATITRHPLHSPHIHTNSKQARHSTLDRSNMYSHWQATAISFESCFHGRSVIGKRRYYITSRPTVAASITYHNKARQLTPLYCSLLHRVNYIVPHKGHITSVTRLPSCVSSAKV